MNWQNLRADCCPRCGDPLSLFDHVSLYKCLCGFKITPYKLENIKMRMEEEEETGFSSGWGFSRYEDDPPF